MHLPYEVHGRRTISVDALQDHELLSQTPPMRIGTRDLGNGSKTNNLLGNQSEKERLRREKIGFKL